MCWLSAAISFFDWLPVVRLADWYFYSYKSFTSKLYLQSPFQCIISVVCHYSSQYSFGLQNFLKSCFRLMKVSLEKSFIPDLFVTNLWSPVFHNPSAFCVALVYNTLLYLYNFYMFLCTSTMGFKRMFHCVYFSIYLFVKVTFVFHLWL